MENTDVPLAIYQFINKRVVTLVLSKGFFELFGLENMDRQDIYDLMDNNMYRDTHPDDLAVLGDAAYRFATEGGTYDVIYRSRHNDEYRIIHAYGRHVYKEDGTRLAFIWYTDQGAYVEDGKTEKNSMMDQIKEHLAIRSLDRKVGHDYLTGLPSMTYFFELAEAGCREMREKGLTPTIVFADFNGMKVYNQKYGLEEGDAYLKTFADEIIDIFSHENCSRFSADHFCIFTDKDKADLGAMELIRRNVGPEGDRFMPLRIGIFVYDDESISISGACDRAKIACDSGKKNYASKIYYFDPKMMSSLEEKQYVAENIDRAIQEEWIKVYFQPIIRTANGRVCAEEALSRWIDPKKGFLNPGDFIPALEETNTIYKLDLYVVDCVLRKMKEHVAKKLHVVPVSVNFSRSDYYTCDLVEEVRKRVDEAGVPRDRIIIEITESIIADDLEYMIEEIKRFKELGFTVWMDDYGSGYSSPVILQKIPFDLIKIDMLFVRQLDEGEKSRIILTEIVRMAMALGMDTIAEGVENKEQADFLKEIGCTMLQGFYFCKPISLSEMFDRYEKGLQIGFENPNETDYYAQLGKVNLYNLNMSSSNGSSTDYFDTWPMVMMECRENTLSVIKFNITFKEFVKNLFPESYGKYEFDAQDYLYKPGAYSLGAVLQCAKDGRKVIIEDRSATGKFLQLLIWRVAVNPVTEASAVMIAVLSSTDSPDSPQNEYARLQMEYARLKHEVESNRKISMLKESVSALLENMPALTFSKDVNTGKYLACNQAFADYAHKDSSSELIGLTDYEIFDEETARHFVEDDQKALSMDKPYIFYEDVLDAKGYGRQFQTTKLKFVDNTGRECLLGLCQDVTDAMRIKREYLEKLAQVQSEAQIDTLTGIKNKNAYSDAEAIMDARILENRLKDFAITVLDVNDLKKINDTLGHKAGDEHIRNACRVICQTFKRSPVFRVGGDEFAVFSQGYDYEHIDELLQNIERHNEEALLNGGVIIACGMARYTNEISVAELFSKADKVMYENKTSLKERQREDS